MILKKEVLLSCTARVSFPRRTNTMFVEYCDREHISLCTITIMYVVTESNEPLEIASTSEKRIRIIINKSLGIASTSRRFGPFPASADYGPHTQASRFGHRVNILHEKTPRGSVLVSRFSSPTVYQCFFFQN